MTGVQTCALPIFNQIGASSYLVIFNIELRYYMCVYSKMGVDNFVVLQIGEKIKVLVHTI